MFLLRSLLRFLYAVLCIVIVLAGVTVLTVVVVEWGSEFYDVWKSKPVIIKQEVISRPTTLEGEMAEMLGWYQVRLNQAAKYVSDQSKEIQRLETRINVLETYIEENGLPTPAEPIDIDLLIR